MRLTFALFVSLVLTASTALAAALEQIPLVWKPTSSIAKLGEINLSDMMKVKFEFRPATDARKSKALIGENREKAEPLPVSTSGDVPAFVTENMKKIVEKIGLNVVEGNGQAIITCEVREFFVTETNNYSGEVILRISLRNRAGKVLWTGTASGSAKRFGRSYKAENYYETLSDSLLEATHSLLSKPGFRGALKGI